jgi:hypothetical protein
MMSGADFPGQARFQPVVTQETHQEILGAGMIVVADADRSDQQE